MEILSDAMFKGNVSVSGQLSATSGASITGCTTINGCVDIGGAVKLLCTLFVMESASIVGQAGFSGDIMSHKDILLYNDNLSTTIPISKISVSEFDLGAGAIRYNENGTDSSSIKIPSKNLEIGTSDISSSLSLNGSSISSWSDIKNYISIPKPITYLSPTIPANCTAFEFVGCSCVSTDADNLIQVKKASDGKSVIAETWITSNKRPAMSFAGCTSEIPAGTYKAVVF